MIFSFQDCTYNLEGARRIMLDGQKVHISFPLNFPELYAGFDQITLTFRDERNAKDIFNFLSLNLLSKDFYEIREIPLDENSADMANCIGVHPGVEIHKGFGNR